MLWSLSLHGVSGKAVARRPGEMEGSRIAAPGPLRPEINLQLQGFSLIIGRFNCPRQVSTCREPHDTGRGSSISRYQRGQQKKRTSRAEETTLPARLVRFLETYILALRVTTFPRGR